MNTTTFHYVQGLSANYHELMVTDKDNLALWGKRAHVALRAYQVGCRFFLEFPVQFFFIRDLSE